MALNRGFLSVVIMLVMVACSRGMESETSQTMAVTLEDAEETIVAYASSEFEQSLAGILHGSEPREFHWVSISVKAPLNQDLKQANGISVDLSDVSALVTFKQVYAGVCNPAKADFSECLLYEKYTSGDEGLSGKVNLRVDSAHVTGSVDLSWEGLTDRFGDPIQLHQHGTIAQIDLPITQLGSR